MRIECQFVYDSAHHLPLVPQGHKCRRMRGHTYVLTVAVSGDPGPDGFVIDFADLKTIIDPIVAELDHHLLNDIPGLENPTVENQLEWLWARLHPQLPGLCQLRLREGMTSEGIYP